ncbi:MAG: DUF4830 domain-containing protein [Ruminococcus sp.]|nr:DUF4830 domain-containing protein [Ruminococcus sp.]
MHFFIIPKKLFKIREKGEKSKRTKSKKKIWIIAISAGVMLLSLVLWIIYAANRVPSKSYAEGVGEYTLTAQTSQQREEFFEQFGYIAKEVSEQEITVPCDSQSFEDYNDLQKSQGLNLNPYGGRRAQMYTMQIGDKEKELFGVIIVYKGKVIGAHLTDMRYPATLSPLCKE